MQWVVLGLNHKTVPVEIREKFAMTAESIKSGLRHIHDLEGMEEAVILSTCNRTEMYAVLSSDAGKESLRNFSSRYPAIRRPMRSRSISIILKGKNASGTCSTWCPGWIPWCSARARS